MNIRHLLSTVLVMVAATSHIAGANSPVTLAQDGKAICTIVLPTDALEFEQLAARELAEHIEKIVGDRPAPTHCRRPDPPQLPVPSRGDATDLIARLMLHEKHKGVHP